MMQTLGAAQVAEVGAARLPSRTLVAWWAARLLLGHSLNLSPIQGSLPPPLQRPPACNWGS